jgi:hemoglobin-like flavoprotein
MKKREASCCFNSEFDRFDYSLSSIFGFSFFLTPVTTISCCICSISLFETCPESKLLFGFPLTIDPRSDALLENQRFLTHATFLLTMIEKTVGLLGENDDQLTETLLGLGRKHMTYGVKPEYFPFMTQAIVKMLKEMIGVEFSEADKKAWEDILGVLITDMVRGERMLDMGLASANKNVTSKNWEKLKEISDYDEVAGLVVFEK